MLQSANIDAELGDEAIVVTRLESKNTQHVWKEYVHFIILRQEFVKVYVAMKYQEAARLRDEIPAAEINEYVDLY